MVIVCRQGVTAVEVREIIETLESKGLKAHLSEGTQTTIIGVVGDKTLLVDSPLEALPGVEKIVPIMESYKLASRSFRPEGTVLDFPGCRIGGKELVMMAGPCAVESESQIMASAKAVKASGAKFLRGGAYKPRTSPYAFQGLELEGLRLMRQAAKEYGLLVISEITSENDIETAAPFVDMIQIGARNAQNFRLLREVGRSGIPVLLKRGIAETIEEWLGSAEYVMSEGNYKVVLCERGIRTFETATRSTLDIAAVPVLKSKTHLPVFVDPSHAAGKAVYVAPLSKASIAAGADGLIVEVHPEPKKALSDAAQQITPEEFDALCRDVSVMAPIFGRSYRHGG
jgi:3-deoxy-7-phosphoheptulonate synthase